MATTTYGTPYVASSDLVSGYPTVSSSLATRIDDVSIKGNGINAQTGTTYTLVLTDAGKAVTLSNASAVTLTIPLNSSVAFPTGTQILLVNLGAGLVTVSPTGGVTLNGTATISQNNGATLLKTGTDTWSIVSGGLPKASASGTTGSPTVDTSSRPGKTIYKWTGAGSVTLTAGTAEILVLAGGGGPGNGTTEQTGGGGAGGMMYQAAAYFPAGTHTVTVGAGGAVGYSGGPSQLGPYYAAGGGNGAHTRNATGGAGGSGGGGGDNTSTGGAGLNGQGNAGGSMSAAAPGGGGGGAGAAAAGGTSSAAGAGLANSITGASVTYGAGGKGGGDGVAATASGANIGKGGDAGDLSGSVAGGSGVVILVIG